MYNIVIRHLLNLWNDHPNKARIFLSFGFLKNIKILNIYLFEREGMGGRKRGRGASMWERNIHRLPLAHTRPGTEPQPGPCPAWESNRWHSALQDDAQLPEQHQSGHECKDFNKILQFFTFMLRRRIFWLRIKYKNQHLVSMSFALRRDLFESSFLRRGARLPIATGARRAVARPSQAFL